MCEAKSKVFLKQSSLRCPEIFSSLELSGTPSKGVKMIAGIATRQLPAGKSTLTAAASLTSTPAVGQPAVSFQGEPRVPSRRPLCPEKIPASGTQVNLQSFSLPALSFDISTSRREAAWGFGCLQLTCKIANCQL